MDEETTPVVPAAEPVAEAAEETPTAPEAETAETPAAE